MRALLSLFVLGALSLPAQAGPREMLGYAGALGEWELTAAVEETSGYWVREFSGPLSMKHVGICTSDGPEEKTGEIRIRISTLWSRLSATFRVEGMECTYSGGSSAPYHGMLACPGREAVPLKLWLR